jgi:hypothetical protein
MLIGSLGRSFREGRTLSPCMGFGDSREGGRPGCNAVIYLLKTRYIRLDSLGEWEGLARNKLSRSVGFRLRCT